MVSIRSKAQVVTADVRLFIAGEPAAVPEYFADLRNEPAYNRQVHHIEKTSEGPIGVGTTFEGRHLGFGRVSWRLAEYEPPRHVAIDGAVGRGRYRWVADLEPASGGTMFAGRMEWEPASGMRPPCPLLRRVLAWNARRAFRRFASMLERSSPRAALPSFGCRAILEAVDQR